MKPTTKEVPQKNIYLDLVMKNENHYKLDGDTFYGFEIGKPSWKTSLLSIELQQDADETKESFLKLSYRDSSEFLFLREILAKNQDIFTLKFIYGRFEFYYQNKPYAGTGMHPAKSAVSLLGKRQGFVKTCKFSVDSLNAVGKLDIGYFVLPYTKHIKDILVVNE